MSRNEKLAEKLFELGEEQEQLADKPKEENTKWRWISYDQDSWNEHNDQSLDYYMNHGKVVLLERLMKNKDFQIQFINRMCDFLNEGFNFIYYRYFSSKQ